MGKKKVILDTNVLISALGWRGIPRTLLRNVIEGKIELVISNKQFNELLKVLDYPKFKFASEQKKRFVSILLEIAILIETKQELTIIKDDPSDNIMLETAIEGKADYIVTGDNHLLKLKEFKGIKIVTPKQFLDLLK